MNKYLVSYVYDGSSIGVGRTIISLKDIDILDIESALERNLNFHKVLVINITKINQKKKEKSIRKTLLQKIFPKTYTKKQFKRAMEKEFDC